MKVIKSIALMSKVSSKAKALGKSIGFVPTMGYLHEGHLSLIKAARKNSDIVVVSIFVNPIQFGPHEDLKIYPRNLRRDIKLLLPLHVDYLFAPLAKEMFSGDFQTFVSVERLSDRLCGLKRPGHFRGVATILAKLFNIVKPDTAYFGKKDFQQSLVIKKMAEDLNIPVKIAAVATVRERDGLAMSSRNKYLSEAERSSATSLRKALLLGKRLIEGGEKSGRKVIHAMRSLISKARPRILVDYIEISDPRTLERKERSSGPLLIALACFVGRTRLIDNIIIEA